MASSGMPTSAAAPRNSDVHATRNGQDYVIDGGPLGPVTQGGVATHLLLNLPLRPELGRRGMALFLVPTHADGVSVGAPIESAGLRCLNRAELSLCDVCVPSASVVSPLSPELHPLVVDDFAYTSDCALGMSAVGIMRAAIDDACERDWKAHPRLERAVLDADMRTNAARRALLGAITTDPIAAPDAAASARTRACEAAVHVTCRLRSALSAADFAIGEAEKHVRDARATQEFAARD